MASIDIKLKSNAKDWAKYMNNIPNETQIIIDENIPSIRKNTKRNVQSHLVKGSGVDEGVYRKSFRINDFSQSKWHVGFQVFARKPHYRLTHLLEYGHKKKVFRWGGSQRTKWGNFGMVVLGGQTKAIPHIEPAQNYAENQVTQLYRKAIKKSMERIKK